MTKTRTKKISINYDTTGELFEKIHQRGAKEFGLVWLTANREVTNWIYKFVDIADPAVKQLISLTILRVLYRLRHDKQLS